MDDKITKLQEHLREHPHDYTAVIALYKYKSDHINYVIRQKRIEKQKKIAFWKERLRSEEHTQQ